MEKEKIVEKLILAGIGLFGFLYLVKLGRSEENIMNISCNIPESVNEGDSSTIIVTLTTPSSNTKEISKTVIFKATSYPTQEVLINMLPESTLTKEFILDNIRFDTYVSIDLK